MAPLGLVIFDLDGVLADTSSCHRRAFAELWAHLGLEGTPYERLAGRSTAEAVALETAPLSPDADQIRAWTQHKQARARSLLTSEDIGFDDTRPALDALQAAGLELAVGTSASAASARLVLQRLGLWSHFRTVCTSEAVSRSKPAPDIYTEVLRRCDTTPSSALVVEDSQAGLQAGLQAGAWTASVRTGLSQEHPRFIGAFADLGDLAASVTDTWNASC